MLGLGLALGKPQYKEQEEGKQNEQKQGSNLDNKGPIQDKVASLRRQAEAKDGLVQEPSFDAVKGRPSGKEAAPPLTTPSETQKKGHPSHPQQQRWGGGDQSERVGGAPRGGRQGSRTKRTARLDPGFNRPPTPFNMAWPGQGVGGTYNPEGAIYGPPGNDYYEGAIYGPPGNDYYDTPITPSEPGSPLVPVAVPGTIPRSGIFWRTAPGKCQGGSASWKCCQANGYKCGEGEGDCDNNDDCAASLVCGTNNCGGGFQKQTYDCCETQKGPPCPRPQSSYGFGPWCTSFGGIQKTYSLKDCDGDGTLDHFCRVWAGSNTGTWIINGKGENGICLDGQGVKCRDQMQHANLNLKLKNGYKNKY